MNSGGKKPRGRGREGRELDMIACVEAGKDLQLGLAVADYIQGLLLLEIQEANGDPPSGRSSGFRYNPSQAKLLGIHKEEVLP